MIAAALWLAGPMVYAAGLGQLSVNSPLGQPLNAEIEIVSLQPGEEEGLVARLAPPEAFRAAGIDFNPALVTVRFTIERRGRPPPARPPPGGGTPPGGRRRSPPPSLPARLHPPRSKPSRCRPSRLPRLSRRPRPQSRCRSKSPLPRKRRSPRQSQLASRLPRKRESSRSRRATR